MKNIELTKDELEFVHHYLESVRFTDCHCDSDWKEGSEIDETFLRESVIDCLAFYSRVECYLSHENAEFTDGVIAQAAHDFWLTRNGHGAGFWDGDWPIYGEMFTKISESFGEANSVFDELREPNDN